MAPGKLLDLFQVGGGGSEPPGIATDRIVAGFFSFLGFPRLQDADALRTAIMRGVETGLFGYATGRPDLGEDGRYRIDRSHVAFGRRVDEDEIDLDSGFLMLPAALPAPPDEAAGGNEARPEPEAPTGLELEARDSGVPDDPVAPEAAGGHEVTLSFTAERDTLFDAWGPLANLADLAGKVSVSVRAEGALDKARLENGVLEPLRELGLIDD